MLEKMDLFGDKPNKVTPVYGIDLGTTNSAISVSREGDLPEIIKLNRTDSTLPSCVMWLGGDNFVVGKEAYNHRYQRNVAYSVKRIIGSQETVTLEYEGEKRVFTPEEISSLVLKELCNSVKYAYGEVKEVVITVPSEFNNKKIKATVKAAELAGLIVLNILREPTAASLVYNLDKDNDTVGDNHILVYDLGGGTFDVSLLRVQKADTSLDNDILDLYGIDDDSQEASKEVLEVIATAGDGRLGGDDLDLELYKILCKRLEEVGVNHKLFDSETSGSLILRLEKIKKLTDFTACELTVEATLCDLRNTKIKQTVMITNDDVKSATEVIYKRTKKFLKEVTSINPNIKASNIVLVGGSTKNKHLVDLLRRDFPDSYIHNSLNPDEAVSLGAAIQAKRVKYGDSKVEMFDIIPLSIGVLADGMVNTMIPRFQKVPYSITCDFSTQRKGQREVYVSVYEGNSKIASECENLGVIKLINTDMDSEAVAVPVRLSIDANGVLSCSARVGDEFKTVELTNLFASAVETKKVGSDLTPRQAKKVNRWLAFAESLPKEKAEKLTSLISNLLNGVECEDIIIEFIKSNRPDGTSKYASEGIELSTLAVEGGKKDIVSGISNEKN